MASFLGNEAAHIRAMQIEDLQRQCGGDILVPNRTFSIPMSSTTGPLSLIVNLSDRFPLEPPHISVYPVCAHPLVNSDGTILQTAHPNLHSWSIHSSLGNTVREIRSRFMQTPSSSTIASQPHLMQYGHPRDEPPPAYSSSYNMRGRPVDAPSAGTRSGAYSSDSGSDRGGYSSDRGVAAPPAASHGFNASSSLPASIPELATLTDRDVEKLLASNAAFDSFFEELETVRMMNNLYQEMLQSTTRELAEANMAKEREMRQAKELLEEKRAQLHALEEEVRALTDKKQVVLQQYSVDSLITRLGEAAAAADSESEELQRSFVNEELEAEEFLKLYRAKRELFHQRSAKRESLLLHHKSR